MRTKYPMLGIDTLVKNIVDTYQVCTERERVDGADWYESAHSYLAGLADTYHVSLETVSKVVAALSPGISWESNLTEAEWILSGDWPTRTFRAYGANVAKALDIMVGIDRLRGAKVVPFAALLINPNVNHVVIDRWGIRVALGELLSPAALSSYFHPNRIRQFVTAYHIAAFRLHIKPSHLQAAVCLHLRKANGL